jgi:hypothetical protein
MKKLKLSATLVILFANLVFANLVWLPSLAVAAEDYYVWVDENGVTNYGEHNPQGFEARHVTKGQRFGYPAREPQLGDAVPQAEQGSEPQGPGVNEQLAEARQTARAAADTQREENCSLGKRNLAQLEAFARIRIADGDGGERYLSDDEKSQRIAQYSKIVQEYCS